MHLSVPSLSIKISLCLFTGRGFTFSEVLHYFEIKCSVNNDYGDYQISVFTNSDANNSSTLISYLFIYKLRNSCRNASVLINSGEVISLNCCKAGIIIFSLKLLLGQIAFDIVYAAVRNSGCNNISLIIFGKGIYTVRSAGTV